MSDIIVGYDGSECAQAALALALDAAAALDDHVVAVFAFDSSIVGGQNADLRAALEDLGASRVAEAAARAQEKGVTLETLVIENAPASALADLAAQRDARMIVVGTHGETPLRGALLGSTPHKLLHLSSKPVLVVPVPA